MLEGLSAPIHPGAMKYYKEAGLKLSGGGATPHGYKPAAFYF